MGLKKLSNIFLDKSKEDTIAGFEVLVLLLYFFGGFIFARILFDEPDQSIFWMFIGFFVISLGAAVIVAHVITQILYEHIYQKARQDWWNMSSLVDEDFEDKWFFASLKRDLLNDQERLEQTKIFIQKHNIHMPFYELEGSRVFNSTTGVEYKKAQDFLAAGGNRDYSNVQIIKINQEQIKPKFMDKWKNSKYLVIAFMILVGFAFYWFQWRPSQVRTECIQLHRQDPVFYDYNTCLVIHGLPASIK